MADAEHDSPQVVYWHRELPPLDAEPLDEHVVEATSQRVAGMIERHGVLWGTCYDQLMDNARYRLAQEVRRLGGDLAHVLDEHVESRHDDAAHESWLSGRFRYVLYRKASTAR